MKIAVITPYWKPSEEKLIRCIESVKSQTVEVTHYLVGDGERLDWIDEHGVINFSLPDNIGSTGSTPRGIGAMLAFQDGFDAIAFLDADNWYEANHIERCVAAYKENNVDVVLSRRNIIFPDGEALIKKDPQDDDGHVDANCYFISKSASFLVGMIGMYPKEFGAGEDRPTPFLIKTRGVKTFMLDAPTVNYESNWEYHYKMADKTPVAPTREPSKRFASHYSPKLYTWLTGVKLPLRRARMAELPSFNKFEDAKIAVVTVYEKESNKVLQALHDSIKDESLNITHYFVANGQSKKKLNLNGQDIKQFTLPKRYPNNGAIGYGLCGMVAFKLGYDIVFFVNADYQIEPGFLKTAFGKMRKNKLDIAYFVDDKLSEKSVSFRPVMISRRMAFAAMIYAQLSGVGERFVRGVLTPFCKKNEYKMVKVKSELMHSSDEPVIFYEEQIPERELMPELLRQLTGWSPSNQISKE